MCGRYYVDDDTAREIEKLIRQVDEKMRKAANIHLRAGDIHPSEVAPVIAADHKDLCCKWQRWGFPGFSGKQLIFNARSESALEKKMFKESVEHRRVVADAVLTPEQIQLVSGGESIEIRVEVTDISDQVSQQDRDVIEGGLADYKITGDMDGEGELTLGAYIDISMYIRIGDGDWDAITKAGEPIEVVIGIPDNLLSDERTYYIAVPMKENLRSLMTSTMNLIPLPSRRSYSPPMPSYTGSPTQQEADAAYAISVPHS